MNKSFWLAKAAKFIVLVALFVTAATFAVQALWNWLVPQVFHGPALTFGQALGLLVLSRLLTGGFGRGGGGGWARGQAWKRRMKQKIEQINSLSPEEREKFKAQMRARCMENWGGRPAAPETAE